MTRFRSSFASLLLLTVTGAACCVAQIAPGDPRPAPPSDDSSSPRFTINGQPDPNNNNDPTKKGPNIQPLAPSDFSVSSRQNGNANAQQQGQSAPAAAPAPSPGSINAPQKSASMQTAPAPAAQTPGWQPLIPPAANNSNNSSINNKPAAMNSNSGNVPAGATSTTGTTTGNAGPTAATTGANQTPAGATSSTHSNLLIGKGDLIEVDVYGAPDFDRNIRVDGNGNAILPMIGAVKVDGLTPTDAEEVIAKKLADGQFFNKPQVTVFIKEYVTQGVTVMGEVQRPGIYPILGPRTLYDAISLAGGTTPKAGNTVTVTHRDSPRSPTTVKIGQNSMENNLDVFPGDIVVVTTAGIVYVVGAVRTPGGYVMDNGHMSLMQALSMAQGTISTASLSHAKLVRRTATGEQQEMPLALQNIQAGKQADIALQPEDIVFVPNSASKSAFHRGLEAAVQAATGVAIYHPY